MNNGRAKVGEVIHASCVAVEGRALLLTGPSGAGKSGLALLMMGLGARLVADDRTELELRDGRLWASCPPAIRGLIEARGIGILGAATLEGAEVAAEVDLSRAETERLPPRRTTLRLGCTLPLILNGPGLSFAAGLVQYLRGERVK